MRFDLLPQLYESKTIFQENSQASDFDIKNLQDSNLLIRNQQFKTIPQYKTNRFLYNFDKSFNSSYHMQEDPKQTSTYNGFTTFKGNYVWAGAMCLAWEQLKKSVIKQPIKLQTKSPKAIQIIHNYNHSNFLKKDLSTESYYVTSGFGQQTVSRINNQVSTKFKKITPPKVQQKLEKTDLISYAYIFKRFDFLSKFQKRSTLQFTFNDSKVESFYADTQDQKRNVFYYEYDDDDNFIIGIKGKNENDSIFLIKSTEDLTIDSVIKTVILKQEKGSKRYLTPIDEFEMPLVKIEATRHLKELQGLRFANQSCKDCYLAKALEGIKFQVNEKGAMMQNFAVIVRKKAKMEIKKIKRFLLDKPFWIVMKEKGRHPYLALKVMNPIDALIKKEKSA